jgi:flagellar FliJ protein
MPARFNFALEPLLEARRRLEQDRQRVVAQIERERLQLEGSLRRQQLALQEDRRSLQVALTGRIDTQILRMQASSSLALTRKAQRIVLELAGVHRRLEAARGELVEASRRRRVVERLRERRFERWKAALDKAETAALDELAVIQAARTPPEERGL